MLNNIIYHFNSSELFWWVAWVVVFVWIFSIPNKIQERNKYTPIDLLIEKYELGEIDEKEYLEKKSQIESLYDLDKN